METLPSESTDHRRNLRKLLLYVALAIVVAGVFFLGLFATKRPQFAKFLPPTPIAASERREVFGFAPYWTLNKLDNVDWKTLTTFAYFSIPVNSDGTFERISYEWAQFESDRLNSLFERARVNNVRRVITLTQMDASTIRQFLRDPGNWQKLSDETVDILKSRGLDGVNVDFEYMGSDDEMKTQFSDFVKFYSADLKKRLGNPYVTVSVIASSAKDNKIYDIGELSKSCDAIFMMAYDFYYPGSEKIGPSAPLFGYNLGTGPFWYDVSTAVSDFLKVAPSEKIILGVPYYGWNYPAYTPAPKTEKVMGTAAAPTTNENSNEEKLLETTPVGGWDSQAMVSWRGYWDSDGWHVAYIEDSKSLSAKYDFVKEKNLKGVGIWALGFDAGDDTLWKTISEKFPNN